jgi:response regulator RpfG family c-di-GMP phosphodiesterase
MATVLLVGEDEMLLKTRAAVLGKIGVEIICSNTACALAVQAAHECELVVLCHSVREGDCAAITEALHERWPKTRVLLIIPQREWGSVQARAVVDSITSSEPERLIGRTAELLRRVGWSEGESAAALTGSYMH